MGILDRFSGALGRKKGGPAAVAKALIDQFGGVDELLERLEASGIADKLSTWVSNEANASLSPEQVRDALGDEALSGVAGRLGVQDKQAANMVSEVLPRLIDRLTPSGRLPEGGFDLGSVNDLLGGILQR